MRIVHASDWHGSTKKLPFADVYVLTGDMFPNFVTLKIVNSKWQVIPYKMNMSLIYPNAPKPPHGMVAEREVIHDDESKFQQMWIEQKLGTYRDCFKNRDAPVVCVRGNHDFTNIAPAVGGDVWEISEDSSRWVSINGVKFGGMRGIPYIAGEWSDEMQHDKRLDIASLLPMDLDVLVTHTPPRGVLDKYGHSFGCNAIASYLTKRDIIRVSPKAHLFGHIHSSAGTEKRGDTIFSNAAETFNIIDI